MDALHDKRPENPHPLIGVNERDTIERTARFACWLSASQAADPDADPGLIIALDMIRDAVVAIEVSGSKTGA